MAYASNLVEKTIQINMPQKPLKLFENEDNFKLYLNDVGILINNLNVDFKDIIFDKLQIGKGIITENYVANQFVSLNIPLYYWNSDYKAEVDFVIENDDGVIPVEVKSADNTKSKSLNSYVEKYKPKYSIRISSKNFGFKNGIKTVPLYAVFCIK